MLSLKNNIQMLLSSTSTLTVVHCAYNHQLEEINWMKTIKRKSSSAGRTLTIDPDTHGQAGDTEHVATNSRGQLLSYNNQLKNDTCPNDINYLSSSFP